VRHSHTSLALRAQCRTGVALELLACGGGVVGRRTWRALPGHICGSGVIRQGDHLHAASRPDCSRLTLGSAKVTWYICPMEKLGQRSLAEGAFESDMRAILENERELGLHSVRFAQMVAQHGGLRTAHILLKPDHVPPPDTFGFLRSRNRLDLAMESYVVKPKYRSLFSDQELEIAQWRLDRGD
jgi:hypothetical protein